MSPLIKPLFLVGLLILSCSATIWDRPADQLRQTLQKGQFADLKTLKIEPKRLKEAASLGPGWAYYLGHVFLAAGREDLAEAAFAQAHKLGEHPWAVAAGQELTQFWLDKKDYAKAEKTARELVSADPANKASQRLLFESLYWQKKDAEAWAVQAGWQRGDFGPADEKENLLFQAVVQARLGKDGWPEAFAELCRRYPAGSLHYRAWSFFEEDKTRYQAAGPEISALVKFAGALANGQLPAAAAAIQAQLKNAAFWDAPGLLENWFTLNRGPQQSIKGAEFLAKMRSGLKNGFAADLWLGRLYREAENWKEARKVFDRALPLAAEGADRDKIIWFLLASAFRTSPEDAVQLLKTYQPQWSDPEYYSDLFGSWLNQSFLDRRYSDIARVYAVMGQSTAPSDRGDYAYILARLSAAGLLNLPTLGIKESPADLYRIARETKPYSYSSFMAYAAEGLSLGLVYQNSGPESEPTAEAKALEDWILGFLNFGLAEKAFDLIHKNPQAYRPDLLRKVITVLAGQALHRPALQLTYDLFGKPGFQPRRSDWELLYPRPFQDLVEGRAKDEKLEPALFYGLVREESAFEHRAKSWAGAVGLSQLMPETAADVARRMGMKKYDITDPADNLAMGARYLAMRLEYFGDGAKALMAYNAGLGRVRGWGKTLADLPDELWSESVPIRETRLYVKKILSSAIMYGLLYYNRNPLDLVRLVFPDFK